jgi:DNA-directed RNA polymerase alpha subunit
VIDPTPDLPDETPVNTVRLPTRIRNALAATEVRTVGEVRRMPDRHLFALQNIGRGSLAFLRMAFGRR